MSKEERVEQEPFMGLVGLHRITSAGGFRLFGSSLSHHPELIELRVSRAERIFRWGEERCFARGRILQLYLSPAQFAEMITCMNRGEGVPCTLSYADGEVIEGVPDDYRSEAELSREDFRNELYALLKTVAPKRKRLLEILGKKGGLTKADREEVRDLVFKIFQWFESNGSYQLEQFERAADRVVTEAKAQVDQFVTGVLTRAGWQALKDRFTGGEGNILMLEAHDGRTEED